MGDQADGLPHQVVVLVLLVVGHGFLERLFRNVLRRSLFAPEGHDAGNLIVGEVGALNTGEAGGLFRRKEHVALADEFLRARAVENGARIGLRTHGKGDAAREVGFDETREYVHRRPLGRDDEVDAHRARHLRQAAKVLLHVTGRRHHQVASSSIKMTR